MRLTDVHHVSFTVTELERTIVFYRDVLGFELVGRKRRNYPGLACGLFGEGQPPTGEAEILIADMQTEGRGSSSSNTRGRRQNRTAAIPRWPVRRTLPSPAAISTPSAGGWKTWGCGSTRPSSCSTTETTAPGGGATSRTLTGYAWNSCKEVDRGRAFALRLSYQHAATHALAGEALQAHPQPMATSRASTGLLRPRRRTGLLKDGRAARYGRHIGIPSSSRRRRRPSVMAVADCRYVTMPTGVSGIDAGGRLRRPPACSVAM